MRSLFLAALTAILLAPMLRGQELSVAEKKIVNSARSRYYSLEDHGFISATCEVSFDFSTVPSLPSEDPAETQKLLRATRFSVMMDRSGASADFHYPTDASISAKRGAEPSANLLASLIRGVFLTWPTKGLDGPIPAFDSQVKSAIATSDGYLLILNFPGDPVRIEMDKKYLVTEIVSVGGKVDEHPLYSPTPDGLIFVGNTAVADTEQSGRILVKYELGNATVDGLRLPNSVHLQVIPNINTRFSLDRCIVKKDAVIQIKPLKPTSPSE